MLTRLRHCRRFDRPQALAIALLAALIFRSYIPIGFMPASGSPFLLELCPAFGGDVHAHHGHHGHGPGHSSSQDCPFGSAPAAAPFSSPVAYEPQWQPVGIVIPPNVLGRPETGRFPYFLARGPPALS